MLSPEHDRVPCASSMDRLRHCHVQRMRFAAGNATCLDCRNNPQAGFRSSSSSRQPRFAVAAGKAGRLTLLGAAFFERNHHARVGKPDRCSPSPGLTRVHQIHTKRYTLFPEIHKEIRKSGLDAARFAARDGPAPAGLSDKRRESHMQNRYATAVLALSTAALLTACGGGRIERRNERNANVPRAATRSRPA